MICACRGRVAPFVATLMVVVVPSSGTITTFCELKPLLELYTKVPFVGAVHVAVCPD